MQLGLLLTLLNSMILQKARRTIKMSERLLTPVNKRPSQQLITNAADRSFTGNLKIFESGEDVVHTTTMDADLSFSAT
jgi:uridylate kinase